MDHNPQATFVSSKPAPKVFGKSLPKPVTKNLTALDWALAAAIATAVGFIACLYLFPVNPPQTFVGLDGTTVTITPEMEAKATDFCLSLKSQSTEDSPCAALLKQNGLW